MHRSMRMKTRNLSADLPFPQDIMIDILHRLPLKTLLTCKRVSKQWKDLIDDPIFYKRHTTSRTAFILGRDTTLSVLFLSHDEDLEMHRVPIDMATCYSRGAELLNLGSPNETMACLVSQDGIFFFYNLFTGATFVVGDAPVRPHLNSWICYGPSGKVSEMNGLLCYSYTMWDWEYGGDFRHVVWVMNEYGVEDSWQKLLSINCNCLVSREIPLSVDDHVYAWDSVAPTALHESEEGRIAVLFVFHYSGKMFWYGLKEGDVRVIDEDHLLKETRLNLKRKTDFVS